MTRAARRRAAAVVGGFLAATLVFFHRVLLTGGVFIGRDILRVYYPLRAYWAERVLSGAFPDWYPFDGLGQPFLGMVISGAFHPLNLLYVLLPLTSALTLNVLLCFPVAGVGAYALARRFQAAVPPAALGGLLFAFSGYLVSSTDNLLYLMAAATVPWALWGADRFLQRPSWARASAAGGLAALVLFSGDVQAFALTLGLFALLAYCRRARVGTGCVLLLSALLASLVQLIPTFQVLRQARAGQQSLAQATLWSTHPFRLLEVLLGPLFAREPGDGVGTALARRLLDSGQPTLWVDSLYLGLLAVVLALLGAVAHWRSRTGRVLTVCTTLLLVLALGKHAGLDALAYHLVPFWRAFRYPEKWMAFASLGLALGAAAGFQAVLERPPLRRKAGVALLSAGLLALFFGGEEAWLGLCARGMASHVNSATLAPQVEAHLSAALVAGAGTSGALALLAASSLLWANRPQLLAWVTPACCFLGLFSLNEPLYKLGSREMVAQPSPFLAAVRGTSWRVLQLGGPHTERTSPALSAVDRNALETTLGLAPVTPALFGVEGANTYLPAVSTRVFDLSDDERPWVLSSAGLFSTRYFSVAEGNAADVIASGKRLIERLPSIGYVLLEDTAALPRAYLAHPLCVGGPAESLERVRTRSFTPGAEAVVECTLKLPPSTGELGDVLVVHQGPEEVALEVRAKTDAVLVLNDAFYSGWRAAVDGVETPILVANHLARAVVVAPGVHRVRFHYRTPGLLWGLLLTLAFLLGGLLDARPRAAPSPPAPRGSTAGRPEPP